MENDDVMEMIQKKNKSNSYDSDRLLCNMKKPSDSGWKSTKPCGDATQNADVISFDKTNMFPQRASSCESVICVEKKDINTQSSTGDNDEGEEEESDS